MGYQRMTPEQRRIRATVNQNRHLSLKGLALLFPGMTLLEVAELKRGIRFPTTREGNLRGNIARSLKRRSWSVREISWYMEACSGQESGIQNLSRCGMWDMDATGIM